MAGSGTGPGCRAEVAFYEDIAATLRIPMPECYVHAIADEGAVA